MYALSHAPSHAPAIRRRSSFLDYLIWTSRLLCENHCDRIYGTLKMFDWHSAGTLPPEPDYNISAADLALDLVQKLLPSHCYQIRSLIEALEIKYIDLQRLEWLKSLSAGSVDAKSGSRRWSLDVQPVCTLARSEQKHLVCNCMTAAKWEIPESDLHSDYEFLAGRKAQGHRYLGTTSATTLCTEDGSILGHVCNSAAAGDIIVTGSYGEIVLRPRTTKDEYEVIGRAAMLEACPRVRDIRDTTIPLGDFHVDLELLATNFKMICCFADRSDLSCGEILGIDIPRAGSIMRDVGEEPLWINLRDWVERWGQTA